MTRQLTRQQRDRSNALQRLRRATPEGRALGKLYARRDTPEKRAKHAAQERRRRSKPHVRALLRQRARDVAATFAGRLRKQETARASKYKILGSSLFEVARLFAEQGSSCAICAAQEAQAARGRNWCLDHNHDTGAVRGVLCPACNKGLGLFLDRVAVCRQAIAYLRKHQDQKPLPALVVAQWPSPKEKRYAALGVTAQQVAKLFEEQNKRCAICETTTPTKIGWCLDHNHTTGAIRGVLCGRCNAGLGFFKEKISLLECALCYLYKHEKRDR